VVSLILVAVVGFYAVEKGSRIVGLERLFGFAMAIFAIVKLLAFREETQADGCGGSSEADYLPIQ